MIILTDVDDVLLDWSGSFKYFVEKKGYVVDLNDEHAHIGKRFSIHDDYIDDLIFEFIEGDEIKTLSPIGGSEIYLNQMKKNGFKFIAITSISDKLHVHQNRMENLIDVYGKGIFEDCYCLPTNGSKRNILQNLYNKHNDEIVCWVDDKYENIADAIDVGIKNSIIYHQTYNAGYMNDNMLRMKNWKEIYQYASSKYKY